MNWYDITELPTSDDLVPRCFVFSMTSYEFIWLFIRQGCPVSEGDVRPSVITRIAEPVYVPGHSKQDQRFTQNHTTGG